MMKTVVLLVVLVYQAYCHPFGRTRNALIIRKDEGVFRLPKVRGGVRGASQEKDSEALSLLYSSTLINEQLQGFVVKTLFRNNPSLCLTKSELELLILEETGLEMSTRVLDELFQRVDLDGNGSVCAKDFVIYLQQIDESKTNSQRALAVTASVLKDVSWLMTLAFISGSSVSILTNILSRSGRSLPLGNITPFRLSAWLFTIGTFGFTAQSYQHYSNRFDLNESAKRVLYRWIKRVKFDEQCLDLNRVEFQKLLETYSVFLPREIIDTLFSEIDPQHTNLVTKSDIEAFVQASQHNKLSKLDKFRAIMSNCSLCWQFWSNFTWLIGSIFFVAASYMPQSNFYTQFLQAGAIFYLLGGVSLLLVLYDDQFEYFSAIEELQRAIHALAIPNTELKKGGIVNTAFRKLDDSGEGMLDSIELYNALQDAGVLIPLNVYMEVFRKADKGGDGRLCLQEFTDFVMHVDSTMSNNKMHPSRSVRKKMSNDIAFWLSSLFVVAGVLFTLESYGASLGISDSMRSNMLLVASSCYAINSSKKVVSTPIIAWREQIILEQNNLNFKNGILASAKEYSTQNRKKGWASWRR